MAADLINMRLSLLFILIFIGYKAVSQSQKKISNPQIVFTNLKKELIDLKIKSNPASENISFSHIKIIDKRYDTTAIGYLRYNNPPITEYYKLVTKYYLSADLESFANKIFQKTAVSNPTLFIVIRKFRFDTDYDFSSGNMIGNSPVTYFLTLGIDCFSFSNNEFTPLIKKDTVIQILQKRKANDKGLFIGENFYGVLTDFLKMHNESPFVKKRKLTYAEVNEYYDRKFREAIFTSQQLKKGVYMNFDEFKKNSPSYLNFEIRKTNLADDIYLFDGENTIPSRNAWGYCDGKDSFIKLGGNLFQLYRQGNSYLLMGNDNLSHRTSSYNHTYSDIQSPGTNLGANALGDLLFSKNKFKLEYIPLELDMETGEIY